MKKLFNISQEEKNRILEMHSAKKNVISEQGLTVPPIGGGTRPAPRPGGGTQPNRPIQNQKPVSQSNKELKVGETINIYDDITLASQPVVSGPVEKITNYGVEGIRIELSDNMGAVTFKCGQPFLEFRMEDKLSNTDRFFNPDLVKTLTTQFCTKNSSGIMVPKAKFAMNNQQNDPTTGVA
jgi:hypothetical protein